MKNEIVLFENQNVKSEVNMKDESVWLNREQLSILFDRDVKTILIMLRKQTLMVRFPCRTICDNCKRWKKMLN